MAEDTLEKLAFLALGWLLGLLGPIIVDAIRRRRENALGRVAILNELRELASVLATAAFGARMRQGTADRRFLEWLKSDLERHATSQQLQAFIPSLRTQLSWSDEELKKIAIHMSSEDGTGLVLSTIPFRFSMPAFPPSGRSIHRFSAAFWKCARISICLTTSSTVHASTMTKRSRSKVRIAVWLKKTSFKRALCMLSARSAL